MVYLAESPIPQYVCSSNETEQNGTLIRINKAYEHIVYPTNCYYTLPSDGIQDGIHYYEFIFVEGNSFVGFTTKDHFADGFHIRGLFYGGTLSDGLASLGAFSRRTHQGDTVGLRIDLTKEKIKIYVHLNGRSLGLAFDVNRGNISALYPTVHTYDDALIRIRKLETFPTETEYQPKVFSGIEGDFAFEQAVDNGKNVSTDGWKQFVLSLRKKPKLSNDTFQVYRLHFAVINSINGFLIKNQNSKYEVKGVESTLIGTYGEALKAEAFVFKLISGLEDVVTNGDNLLIKSKSNTQLNLKRFTKPAPTAVTLNPILGEYNFG
ncbi:hypothetical protein B4U79_16192 [Dinothrombium tinctorium]|uniref:B30.2/SPRY domain-containing protein n=1 Tax=Dinothrombium tinctorium TaxID=1965070 RepID=A0A3S3P1L2_9ACAR|nr:hypothetical protein B4U79_16244 [Dinothrombium tinctorium]RWS06665.1 hypothetical protein B4U79_16192 [Dinothrombium tinctorium]